MSSRSLFDRKRDEIVYSNTETCLDILMSQSKKGVLNQSTLTCTDSGRNSPTIDMQFRRMVQKFIDNNNVKVNIEKIVSVLLETDKSKVTVELINNLIETHKV